MKSSSHRRFGGTIMEMAALRRMGTRLQIFLFAASVPVISGCAAQAPAKAPVLTSNVDEVQMDVVAHDKHGRPIRDLRGDELQIMDDGAAAKITGLRLISTASDAKRINSLAIVFDDLHSDANRIALRAAQFLLKENSENNFYYSVWHLHNRLELIETLTDNQPALKRAFDTALKVADGKLQATAASEAPSLAAADPAKGFATQLEHAGSLAAQISRDENLPPLVAGLLALIRQQADIPGRKTLLYFSDGRTLDSLSLPQFQAIVGAANRAHVSIYAVDASGVKPANDYNAGMFTLHGNAAPLGPNGPAGGTSAAPPGQGPPVATSLSQPTPGVLPQVATSTSNAQLTIAAQLHDQSEGNGLPLRKIADQTGGLYMSETSNLFDSLREMVGDVSSYYEATYAPEKVEYDGHFRSVRVRVTRPHVLVQARAGYFSLAPNIGGDLRPFEMSLLKALAQPAKTEVIPFDARVLRFRAGEKQSTAELVIALPLSNIGYQNDGNNRLCKLHFSILALVKDAEGQIVKKVSEDLPLQTALENSERVRQSTHYFERSFSAAPGKFTLEVAVSDVLNHRVSAASFPFELPSEPNGLAVSDVAVVHKLEPLARGEDGDDPLRYRDYRVVPKVGPASEAPGSELRVFFTIYPDAKGARRPQVEMEFRQDHTVVAKSSLKLPESHGADPIPVLATFSKLAIPDGDYELWAKVSDGSITREQKLELAVTGDGHAGQVLHDGDAEAGRRIALLVEPKLLANRPKPSDEDVKQTLDAARRRAIDYKDALPNFSCNLITRRSVDRTGNSNWKQKDLITQLLRYIDGKEDYHVLQLNGERPVTETQLASTGVWSSGEFGQFLDAVFSPKAQAQFEWEGFVDVNGTETNAFKYRISHSHSLYSLSSDNRDLPVGYHGFVYIDRDSMTVRRVSIEAEGIPAKFPIQESAITVDYSYFSIGGQQYLLPASATLYVREGKHRLSRNEKQFRDYRRYSGESTIKFN